ncbi:hypothetical protein ACSFBF_22805 [Variovorax sp. ZT5P49]|uniref:hypothetical protein n=1 Tax=Variovorax sp. ZT5P49 TaxID=3443733 RepID=UPI003F4455AD
MNKRLIARLMQARVPGLRNSGVYFFRGDFEHILTGAVLEYVPRGLYVWNFRFPLFDFFCPHLTFSDRLQVHPFIGKEEMSEEAIVDFVLSSPEVRSAFGAASPMGLPEFVQYLESDGMRNPHGRLIFAAALVLLGQEARATELLDELPPVLHPTDIPRCNRLRTSLRQGPEAARALLEQVRQENLRAFGVGVD